MCRLRTCPSSCAITTSSSPRVKRPSSKRVPEHDVRRRAEAGGERVRLGRPRRDVLHAHGRAGDLSTRSSRSNVGLQPRVAERMGLDREQPARGEREGGRDRDDGRARRAATSAGNARRARRAARSSASPRPPRRRAWPTARRARRARRTGPRPQWCCHQSSAIPNGRLVAQSVTSTTIPTTIALPIRPSSMPRTLAASAVRGRRARRARRRCRASQSACTPCA